jgi:hypothetical protein
VWHTTSPSGILATEHNSDKHSSSVPQVLREHFLDFWHMASQYVFLLVIGQVYIIDIA